MFSPKKGTSNSSLKKAFEKCPGLLEDKEDYEIFKFMQRLNDMHGSNLSLTDMRSVWKSQNQIVEWAENFKLTFTISQLRKFLSRIGQVVHSECTDNIETADYHDDYVAMRTVTPPSTTLGSDDDDYLVPSAATSCLDSGVVVSQISHCSKVDASETISDSFNQSTVQQPRPKPRKTASKEFSEPTSPSFLEVPPQSSLDCASSDEEIYLEL